ncbi:hypothetical protein Pelo_2872 [Pelomyxa schiedti]|nr:hypothetical protein Pelo_2872 [Pelomyxa schiedti]
MSDTTTCDANSGEPKTDTPCCAPSSNEGTSPIATSGPLAVTDTTPSPTTPTTTTTTAASPSFSFSFSTPPTPTATPLSTSSSSSSPSPSPAPQTTAPPSLQDFARQFLSEATAVSYGVSSAPPQRSPQQAEPQAEPQAPVEPPAPLPAPPPKDPSKKAEEEKKLTAVDKFLLELPGPFRKVVRTFLWGSLLHSAIWFVGLMFIFTSVYVAGHWYGYHMVPVLSLLCLLAIALHGAYIYAHQGYQKWVQKVAPVNPFALSQPFDVPNFWVEFHLGAICSLINSHLEGLFYMLYFQNPSASAKFMGVLLVLCVVGHFFSGFAVLAALSLFLFTIPPLYVRYPKRFSDLAHRIHQAMHLVCSKCRGCCPMKRCCSASSATTAAATSAEQPTEAQSQSCCATDNMGGR